MSKLPRGVSPERLERFLRRNGFIQRRHGGRHSIWSNGERNIPVPRHGPLKVGTLYDILKSSGIPKHKWNDL